MTSSHNSDFIMNNPSLQFPITHPFKLYFEKEPDYDKIKEKIDFLNLFSNMTNQHVFIIDFYKSDCFYISINQFVNKTNDSHFTFDNDYASFSVVNKEKHLESKSTIAELLSAFDKDTLKKSRLYSAHPIKLKSEHIVMISNQYRPILFDDHGKVWMLVGNTTLLPAANHATKMYIDFMDTNERFVYSPEKKTFKREEIVKLTNRETNILVLSSQGYTSKEIAGIENILMPTVKFHKRNILTKFNVQTIQEAIVHARSHHFIDRNNKYLGL